MLGLMPMPMNQIFPYGFLMNQMMYVRGRNNNNRGRGRFNNSGNRPVCQLCGKQ